VFKVKDYTFMPLAADRERNIYINQQHFTAVLSLIDKHKNKLLDDYMPNDAIGIIQSINNLYPHFYICFKGNEFMGFIYCYQWKGNGKKYHSCFITAAAERKFYGKPTREAFGLFCNYLYDAYGLIKIRAEVDKNNKLCQKLLEDNRFKKEGFIKACSVLNGEVQDRILFGKVNNNYLKNLKEN
jgi:RimJ/RimL family protein N-acetyltransferase